MSPAGVGWRGRNGQTTKIVGSDVLSATWVRIGLPFELKLESKGGAIFKFDGFREADQAVVKKYVEEAYRAPWKEDSVSHKGWNWGEVEVVDSTLKFQVSHQPSFEVPLNEATSANVTKTEVSISFNPSGEVAEDCDALAEIKFFVPNTRGDTVVEPSRDHIPFKKAGEEGTGIAKAAAAAATGGAKGENGEGEDEDEIPEYNEELLVTPAEALANKIMDKIEVLPANAQPIIVFERTSMSTPRGQIDLQLHPTFFFLAGKNFRIDYTSVTRIFLLPQPREDMSAFVVSLDPPIRQGSTSYPLIVFSLPNKEVEVTLNQDGVPENSRARALGSNVSGALDQVIASVLGTLADKKVTVPATNGFKSTKDEPFVSCKYKAGDGFLYPLENSFICVVPKNPVHIPFSDIASVGFELISQSFTMEVQLKTGASHPFMVIPAPQHLGLWNFCKSKNIKVHGNEPITEEERSRSKRSSALASRAATRQQIRSIGDDDEDEDDDEFQAGDEEDDDDESVSEGSGEDEEDIPKPKKKAEKARANDGGGDAESTQKKKKKKTAATEEKDDDDDE